MNALRLRFPNNEPADLELRPGVHAIGRDADGHTTLVAPGDALARFCVDRRGVWLQVGEGVRGLHVNGRPVRRMAMLRAGDAVYLDGVELLLLGAAPASAATAGRVASDPAASDPPASDPRVVVRGVGGAYHGRSFTLAEPRRVGRAAGCDIRLGEAKAGDGQASLEQAGLEQASPEQARLEPHADGVLLRTAAGSSAVVNGHRVGEALLRAGDQVVFDSQQRFVVEAPLGPPPVAGESPHAQPSDDEATPSVPASGASKARSSMRRMPLLLLAALLLSAALSLLLMYGAR